MTLLKLQPIPGEDILHIKNCCDLILSDCYAAPTLRSDSSIVARRDDYHKNVMSDLSILMSSQKSRSFILIFDKILQRFALHSVFDILLLLCK